MNLGDSSLLCNPKQQLGVLWASRADQAQGETLLLSASEPLAIKTLALSFTNSNTTSHHLQACHSLLCYCCCNRFIKYRHKVKEDCTSGRYTSGFCRSSHGVTMPPRVQERDVVSEVVAKLSWEHSPKAGKETRKP